MGGFIICTYFYVLSFVCYGIYSCQQSGLLSTVYNYRTIMVTESVNQRKCPRPNLRGIRYLCGGIQGDYIKLAHNRFSGRDMKSGPSTFKYYVLQIESVWFFFVSCAVVLLLLGLLREEGPRYRTCVKHGGNGKLAY